MLDVQALADVGFPALAEAVADRARTPMGRARCLALPLLNDRAAVERHLDQIEEARARLRSADAPPLGEFGDMGAHLQRAEKQGLLEGSALLEVAGFARACSRLRGYLEDRASQAPLLAAEGEALVDLPLLAARIETAIEPSGRVADRASAALGQLRDRVRQLHQLLRQRLEELIADEKFQRNLREGYLTVRNDRYCVPVNAQFRAEVPGIVHNASQSGQTLFVEPQALIGLGNELAIAQSMATEEEQRLRLELTAEIGRAARDLREAMAALARVDELFAGAALAQALSAHRPEVVDARAPFAFEALRHPLLVLQAARPPARAEDRASPVIPSDVLLGPQSRALVISGPNAGGKTVTLTAIGLCAAMVRAGLPIPAGPLSRVPLIGRLFTAIGDSQDLERGLSTFSAHLARLRSIVLEAGPGSLALIDEMAADTDPAEGGALAIAVLEELLDRGALVVATTHLEPLKALALGDRRFANAAVGFDAAALAPTYRLTLGSAGQSSALEIARRCGLPEGLIERARGHLSSKTGPLGAAIAALGEERQRLAQARAELDLERERATREREELRARTVALSVREAEAAAGARRELLLEIGTAREEVRAILAHLQREPALQAAGGAQRALDALEADQRRELSSAQPKPEPPTSAPRPTAGHRVRSQALSKEGELLSIEGETGLVAFGAIKLRQPLSDLVQIQGRRATPVPQADGGGFRSSRREKERRAVEAAGGALPQAASRCDLRGLRADEAVREAERFLDQAYGEGASEVLLVHGLGSGALKASVRGFLAGSSYVRAFRAAEAHQGGEGTTLVELAS